MPAVRPLPDRLILASRSPRRRQLLEQAGYTFDVQPADDSVECGVCSGEGPVEMVARLALEKALDVGRQLDRGIVIGCDTVASLNGQIFGKPADEAHARQILESLRGREHQVYTGLCVWHVGQADPKVEIGVTILKMHHLSDEQLDEYLDSGLWEGKAGAFGYQDRQGWLDVVQGSESNVVGLPLELLDQMLGDITHTDT